MKYNSDDDISCFGDLNQFDGLDQINNLIEDNDDIAAWEQEEAIDGLTHQVRELERKDPEIKIIIEKQWDESMHQEVIYDCIVRLDKADLLSEAYKPILLNYTGNFCEFSEVLVILSDQDQLIEAVLPLLQQHHYLGYLADFLEVLTSSNLLTQDNVKLVLDNKYEWFFQNHMAERWHHHLPSRGLTQDLLNKMFESVERLGEKDLDKQEVSGYFYCFFFGYFDVEAYTDDSHSILNQWVNRKVRPNEQVDGYLEEYGPIKGHDDEVGQIKEVLYKIADCLDGQSDDLLEIIVWRYTKVSIGLSVLRQFEPGKPFPFSNLLNGVTQSVKPQAVVQSSDASVGLFASNKRSRDDSSDDHSRHVQTKL